MISLEVRRKMERILARENPRSAIVGFASPAVLDEKNWNAIGVAAAPAEGALEYAWISYKGQQNYSQEDFPVAVPLGATVSATVQFANYGDFPQYMTCTVEFIDPDGYSRGENHRTTQLDPLAGTLVDTDDIVIDKEGTWKIHALLETYTYPS